MFNFFAIDMKSKKRQHCRPALSIYSLPILSRCFKKFSRNAGIWSVYDAPFKIKVRQPKSAHEKHKPRLSPNKPTQNGNTLPTYAWSLCFYQIPLHMRYVKKSIIYPWKIKDTPIKICLFRLFGIMIITYSPFFDNFSFSNCQPYTAGGRAYDGPTVARLLPAARKRALPLLSPHGKMPASFLLAPEEMFACFIYPFALPRRGTLVYLSSAFPFGGRGTACGGWGGKTRSFCLLSLLLFVAVAHTLINQLR